MELKLLTSLTGLNAVNYHSILQSDLIAGGGGGGGGVRKKNKKK